MAHKLRISDNSNRGIGDTSSSPRLTMSSIPGPLPSSLAEESKVKPPRKKNFFKSLWKGLKSEVPKVSSSPNLNKQISSAPPPGRVHYSEDALSRKIARLEAERKQEKDVASSSRSNQPTRIATTCPPRGGVSKVDNTRYAVVRMVVQEADDDAVARKIAEHDNPRSSATPRTKPTASSHSCPPHGGQQQPSKVVDATVDNTRYAVVQMVLQQAEGEDDEVAKKIAEHDNGNASSSLKRALTSDAAITRRTATRTSGGKSSLRRALTADAAAPNRRTGPRGNNSARKRSDTNNSSTTYPVPPTKAANDAVPTKPNNHQTLRRARTSDSALSSRAKNVLARGGLSSLRRALTAEAPRRKRERINPNNPKQSTIDTARYTVVQMVVQQADNDAVASKASSQHSNQSTLRNSDRAPSTRAARNGLSSLRRALTDTAVGRRQPKTTIRRGASERSFPKKTKGDDLDWENVESALLSPGKDGKKDEKTLANSKPNGPLLPPPRRGVAAAPGRTSPPPTKTLNFWPGAKPEEARAELDDSGNVTPPLPQPQLQPGAFSMVPSFVSPDPPQEEIPAELLLLAPEMDESLVAETDLERGRATTTTTTTLPQAQPVTESDYESYSQLKQLQNEYANHEAQMAEMQKQLEEMQRVQQELDRLKEALPQAEAMVDNKGKKPPKKNKAKKKEKAAEQPVLERPKGMTDEEWVAYQYLCGL